MTVVLDLTHTLYVTDIAHAAKLSVKRIQQLDDLLAPRRDHRNHRRYSIESLTRFLASRGITIAHAA